MFRALAFCAFWLSTVVLAAPAVKVGSKIDSEGQLFGQILLQVLRAHHVPLEDHTELGTTPVLRAALVHGEVDLAPSYTGNGAFFTQTPANPRWHQRAQAYAFIRDDDQRRHQLLWLPPAPANNTWGIAVNDALYRQGVRDFPSLKKYLAAGGEFRLAASAEFVDSPLALPAFAKVYGLKLKPEQVLTLSGGNTAATIHAAALGTSGVNAAMVYSTDGAIESAHLHVLPDTQAAQAIYAPTFVARAWVFKAYPQLPQWFAPVLAHLDDATLRRLNHAIVVEGKAPAEVARAYLKSLTP